MRPRCDDLHRSRIVKPLSRKWWVWSGATKFRARPPQTTVKATAINHIFHPKNALPVRCPSLPTHKEPSHHGIVWQNQLSSFDPVVTPRTGAVVMAIHNGHYRLMEVLTNKIGEKSCHCAVWGGRSTLSTAKPREGGEQWIGTRVRPVRHWAVAGRNACFERVKRCWSGSSSSRLSRL